MNKRTITALLVILLVSDLLAQSKQSDKLFKRAKKYYDIGFYEKAHELYLQILKIDSTSIEANYYCGIIILEDSNHKWEALHYLLKSYSQDSLLNKIDYYLGMAYQFNNDFGTALSSYQRARLKVSPYEKEVIKDVEKRIGQCKVGIKLNDNSKGIEVKNLGPNVNSPSDDYAPIYSPADEKMIFTSNRKGSKRGLLGLLTNQSYDDIYETDKKSEENWKEARNIGSAVNTKYHDSGLSFDQTGNTMLIYHSKNNGDIFMSEFVDGKWSNAVSLGENINTPEYLESSATLSPDGRSLYFTSSRPGGFGGTDIYVCERNGSNQWGKVRNLGAVINTDEEEEAPYISSDGSTLYFSSTGHKGIGGFDIFYSEKNPVTGEWGKPKNFGIPVNTPQDDIYFVLSQDGKNGYYSAIHKDTYGERDIYRISMVDDSYQNATLLANSNVNPQDENSDPNFSENSSQEDSESVSAANGSYFDIKPLIRNIYFNSDNNDIREKYHNKLDRLVACLEQNKNIAIEISGHADNVGDRAYNAVLSIKRAESVRQYLVDKGIAPSRLIVKGYGSKIPLASNDDEVNGRDINRRVEMELFEKDLTVASLSE